MAIQHDLAYQLVHIFLNLIMLNHDNHEVNSIKELIKIMILISHDVPLDERIVDFQASSEMALLAFQQLKGWRLTHIIHVLFISQTIKADTVDISHAFFIHDFVDAIKNEIRHAIIGLHGLINDLGKRGIIAYQEPRVNRGAMTANTRTRL